MQQIKTYEEYQQIKSQDRAVIKLGAIYCSPCKQLDKQLEQIDIFTVSKVDVDDIPEVASELGVMSVPSTFFFKNGEIVGQFTGVKSKEEIEQMYEEIYK